MHDFFGKVSRIINTGKSRSILLTGNVYDLFYDGTSFVPLVDFLAAKYNLPASENQKGVIRVLYEVNRKIRIVGDDSPQIIRTLWNRHYNVEAFPIKPPARSFREPTKTPEKDPNDFDTLIAQTGDNATFALEFLRKLTEITRQKQIEHNLIIVIEGVDMLIPNQPIAQMNFADRKRIAILHDWFGDPSFFNGHDSVLMIAESRSTVNSRVVDLPQVIVVDVPNPNQTGRAKYAEVAGKEAKFLSLTAGLSINAYRQLLADPEMESQDVVGKVEEYITSLVGEDVIEFKRPQHTLDDAIGYDHVKQILKTQILNRLQGPPEDCIPGALISGPIGGGKTYLLEGLAGMANVPVMVLKNFRSQWFGQTDVMVERIKRAIYAIVQDGGRLIMFVDEADTAFGGLSQDVHETERRSTGKIQALMSDPMLRGKVVWLLMTARPHLLSPDMRREGRAGELVIPILDPSDYGPEEHITFVEWMLEGIPHLLGENGYTNFIENLCTLTKDWSAGKFRAVKSRIRAENCHNQFQIIQIIDDTLSPNIGSTRYYQKLQALMNTSRKSFLPKSMDYNPTKWETDIRALEIQGVR